MAINDAEDLPPADVANNADWSETLEVLGIAPPAYQLALLSARAMMRIGEDGRDSALDISTETGGLRFVGVPTVNPTSFSLVWDVPSRTMDLIEPHDGYFREIVIYYAARVMFAGRGPVIVRRGIVR